ncbi:MAG: nucleotidyltransferase domain-containing protein [Candidatus Cloacimonetes bacterium]|nr:nucleotidyltransferase domain-containing protein [Candidatus Cloacimonadota bacterium]
MTKKEILNFLKQQKQYLKDEFGVYKIGLFGSYAKGTNQKHSDIDIAIEIYKDKKNLHVFLAIKRYLEENFETGVDLGLEHTLKPVIKEKIKKEIIYV